MTPRAQIVGLAAAVLALASGTAARAEEKPADYRVLLYGFEDRGLLALGGAPVFSAGVEAESGIVDLGAAAADGSLTLGGLPLSEALPLLRQGDAVYSLAEFEPEPWLHVEHYGPLTSEDECNRFLTGSESQEYLVAGEPGEYRLERVESAEEVRVKTLLSAPDRMHFEYKETRISGREPLPGSTLDAGKPVFETVELAGELAAARPGIFVGALAAPRPLLIVAEEGPFPAPPRPERRHYAIEMYLLRLEDDQRVHEPLLLPALEGEVLEGVAVFRLSAATREEAIPDAWGDGQLLLGPRITLLDGQVWQGEARPAVLYKSLLRHEATAAKIRKRGAGVAQDAVNVLEGFTRWFSPGHEGLAQVEALQGSGVILADLDIDGSAPSEDTGFLAILKVESGIDPGLVRLRVYQAIREPVRGVVETRWFNLDARLSIGAQYALVPSMQPENGAEVIVLRIEEP